MGERGWLPACEFCLDVMCQASAQTTNNSLSSYLPCCEECQKELEELRIVWEALPTDMEQIEPPLDLKSQVMNAVLAAEGGIPVLEFHAARRRPLFGKRSTSALFAAAIAVIMLISLWNVQLYRDRSEAPLPLEEALSVSAAHITQLVRLQSASPRVTQSSGVACIVDNGQSKQFVIDGAPVTNGDWAYQVWLVKDGKRSSAGTFRVHQTDRGSACLPCRSLPIS